MAMWNRILFPVSNLWDHGGSGDANGNADPTSFTASGGQYEMGDLAPESIDKSQNSQTQYIRSLTNLTGMEGKKTTEAGQDTTQQGMDALKPVMDYFQRLMSGDRSEVSSAIQPENDAISEQFGQIRRMFSDTARGGGKTSTLAQLPFQETQQKSQLINQSRRNAAGQAGGFANALIGQGLQQTGMGLSTLGNTTSNLLGIRGQDNTENAQNKQMATQAGQLAMQLAQLIY